MADQPSPASTPAWSVLILNDEFTPMEFVVHVLQEIFHLDRETAMRIMLHAHHNGIAECAIFPETEAKAKAAEVLALARKHRHPLQCVCEQKAFRI